MQSLAAEWKTKSQGKLCNVIKIISLSVTHFTVYSDIKIGDGKFQYANLQRWPPMRQSRIKRNGER